MGTRVASTNGVMRSLIARSSCGSTPASDSDEKIVRDASSSTRCGHVSTARSLRWQRARRKSCGVYGSSGTAAWSVLHSDSHSASEGDGGDLAGDGVDASGAAAEAAGAGPRSPWHALATRPPTNRKMRVLHMRSAFAQSRVP